MDELSERLGRLSASAVHDVLRGLGHDDCTLLPDIRPVSPGSRLAGRVVLIDWAWSYWTYKRHARIIFGRRARDER